MCRICKRSGHYAAECPNVICRSCGGKGHFATECPLMEDADAAAARGMGLTPDAPVVVAPSSHSDASPMTGDSSKSHDAPADAVDELEKRLEALKAPAAPEAVFPDVPDHVIEVPMVEAKTFLAGPVVLKEMKPLKPVRPISVRKPPFRETADDDFHDQRDIYIPGFVDRPKANVGAAVLKFALVVLRRFTKGAIWGAICSTIGGAVGIVSVITHFKRMGAPLDLVQYAKNLAVPMAKSVAGGAVLMGGLFAASASIPLLMRTSDPKELGLAFEVNWPLRDMMLELIPRSVTYRWVSSCREPAPADMRPTSHKARDGFYQDALISTYEVVDIPAGVTALLPEWCGYTIRRLERVSMELFQSAMEPRTQTLMDPERVKTAICLRIGVEDRVFMDRSVSSFHLIQAATAAFAWHFYMSRYRNTAQTFW